MALTFRTGSGGKGSALTIDELDNNFRHFTGSHDVSGSLEVTGSIILTGSLDIEGNLTASGGISSSAGLISNTVTTSGDITSGNRLIVGGRITGGTLTVSHEVFAAHITASANISASGNIIANGITLNGNDSDNSFINFKNDNVRILGDSTSNVIITGGLKADSHITSSGNISSSANVSGFSGSFTGLILTAPNGNQFKFTTDNSGLLSITGSAV